MRDRDARARLDLADVAGLDPVRLFDHQDRPAHGARRLAAGDAAGASTAFENVVSKSKGDPAASGAMVQNIALVPALRFQKAILQLL